MQIPVLSKSLEAHPLAADLAVALEAAAAAGDALLEYDERLSAADVRSKGIARDLVTAADLASEAILIDRLRRAFPGHAIEAEETVRDPLDDRPRWFLDPLDGTTNFVHGLFAWAVSMGLWIQGRPVLAVVHAPRLGETALALAGAGGLLLGPRGTARPLCVRSTQNLAEAVLATGFPYRRAELPNSNLENFCSVFPEVRGLRRIGSAALDLTWVAAGRLDGFWELHLAPHDVAAGGLLVREAGGVVTDAAGGEDWLRGGSILAAGDAIQRILRSRIRA